MKYLKYGLLSVLAVIAMLLILVTYLIRGSLPDIDTEVDVSRYYSLSDSTVIERDELGMVKIIADTREDAGFALGYAHGQDRFFQLDLQRRYAAGELSELFGASAVERDAAMRIHDFRTVAQSAVANLGEDEFELLSAYTAGVNAGLESLDVRPFEYLLTRQQPEPWKNEDSLLVSIFMFVQMTSSTTERDFVRDLLVRAGGDELLDFIQPRGTIWDSAIDGTQAARAQLPSPDLFSFNPGFANNEAELSIDEPINGSNSWAVSGNVTATGSAILANDPHLGMSIPHIWYRTQLNYTRDGKAIQVTGVGLPGLPGVAIGSNGSIAWGMTNSSGDWADLIELEINDGQYLTDNGFKAFETREEVIHVAGGDSVVREVRLSDWGPVVELEGGRTAAIRWLPHHKEAVNAFPLLGISELDNVTEAIELAKSAGISPFNFIAVGADGDIAWTISGFIPRRSGVQGDRVIPWDVANEDWSDWLTPEEYPVVSNPESNYLWTANNRIVGGESLSKIGDGQYELGARGWLIEQDLKSHDQFDEQILASMVFNNRAILLDIWKAKLIEVLESQATLSEGHQQALDIAKAWDGYADTQSTGYTLVKAFRDQFAKAFNGSLINQLQHQGVLPEGMESESLISRQTEGVFRLMLTEEPSAWLDSNYDSWSALYIAVLDEAISSLEERFGSLEAAKWGDANKLDMAHPMSRALPEFLAQHLRMPATPQAGGAHMPLAAYPTHGQSMRLIVSPGYEDKAYMVIPGGQSGHPLSEFFDAGHDDWVEARRTPMLPGVAKYRLELH